MPADRGHIDLPSAQIDGNLAGGLGDVGVEQRARLLGDRRERRDILHHADLVVHRHDADQQRRHLQCRAQRIGVQQPVGPHRQEHRFKPLVGEIAHRFEDALVLGRHGDDAAALITGALGETGGAHDRDVVALGVTGGELQLFGIGADQRCDLRAGILDRGFRLGAHHVLDAMRVAVVFGEPGQHRRRHAWIAAGGRLVIEIDRAVRAWKRTDHGGQCGFRRRVAPAPRGAGPPCADMRRRRRRRRR